MAKLFTLSEYIEFKTGAQVARELGVDENTVYYWKAKKTCPRPHMAHKLIKQTGGLLSWEGIFQPYVDHNNDDQLEMNLDG